MEPLALPIGVPEPTLILLAAIAAAATVIASVVSAIATVKSHRAHKAVEAAVVSLTVHINSRFDEMLLLAGAAGEVKGREAAHRERAEREEG
jgi:hypothetical protein